MASPNRCTLQLSGGVIGRPTPEDERRYGLELEGDLDRLEVEFPELIDHQASQLIPVPVSSQGREVNCKLDRIGGSFRASRFCDGPWSG